MDNQTKDQKNTASLGIFSAAAPAEDTTPEIVQLDPAAERELLMARARLLGVEFSNNIGIDTLRQRINAKLDADDSLAEPEIEEVEEVLAPAATINALTGEASNAPKKTLRETIHDEQMKLVRIRVTCMDPKKKDLHGEVFTLANEYLGTVRKFVPFGEATENGFHVPYCIYTMMEERRFLNIRTVKDRRTGRDEVQSNYAKEFAMEILDPLTPIELAQLANAQAAAGSID